MKTRPLITAGVILTLIAATLSVAAYAPPNNRERILWDVRQQLTQKVNSAISYLNELRSIVDSLDEFTVKEKKEIKSELTGYINFFENKKSEINTAETREEFIFLVREMLDKWGGAMLYKESREGLIVTSKFDDVIVKAEGLSDRIDTETSRLEADGRDTTKLVELHTNFDAEISSAEKKVSDAKGEFRSINNQKGYNLLAEAKKSLYAAYRILRDIIGEFRQLL